MTNGRYTQVKKLSETQNIDRVWVGAKLKEVVKERNKIRLAYVEIKNEETRLRALLQEPYMKRYSSKSKEMNLVVNKRYMKGAIFE